MSESNRVGLDEALSRERRLASIESNVSRVGDSLDSLCADVRVINDKLDGMPTRAEMQKAISADIQGHVLDCINRKESRSRVSGMKISSVGGIVRILLTLVPILFTLAALIWQASELKATIVSQLSAHDAYIRQTLRLSKDNADAIGRIQEDISGLRSESSSSGGEYGNKNGRNDFSSRRTN